ncbi:MAG TPA: CRTAC1 family protein [Candidatus Polarisedimenticolaceae bacterium]|nr:CRTAC1 family protein [Candidatus Polarisedimenticolaceae bacterium]
MRQLSDRPTVSLGFLVVGLATLAYGSGPTDGDSRQPTDGQRRMLQLFSKIRELTPSQNPYLGDERTRGLRRQVAAFPADVPVLERVRYHLKLGRDELRLGNPTDAIAQYTAAMALVPGLDPAQQRVVRNMLSYHLGVANLRWGENLNCVSRHTADSCLLPIRGGGVHTDQTGSRAAIEYFNVVLENSSPDSDEYVAARWLVNIAFMTIGEYPDAVPQRFRIDPAVFASDEPFPRFVNEAAELGLDRFDLSGGAIADDFDGDQDFDLVVSSWDPAGGLHYYRNDGGGRFAEQTADAGLAPLIGGLNLVHADYDNDGDLDLLVLRGAWLRGEFARQPNSLLRNDGAGRFVDVTFEAGLGEVHHPTQTAAWADFDLDGDLDLYVGNESTADTAHPGQLFRNEGDGTFLDVAVRAGVQNFGYAKGVAWGDYDADGYPDLYVSNLASANRLYHNNGDGTFTDVADRAGVALPLDSFPTWFFDFDNDGALDLFVAGYDQADGPSRLAGVAASYLGLPHDAETHRLYRGDGRGGFTDVTAQTGLDRVAMTMGANYGDLDNDGFLDFYLGTGYPDYEALMPNVMYRNVGGRKFADVTTAGGFGHLQKGHAVVFADLDGDGDQDVFEQMGGAYPGDAFGNVFYRNPGHGRNHVELRVVGVRSNRFGLGTRVRLAIVEGETRREIHRHVASGGSFGANPYTLHVGIGQATRVESIEVFWPATGATQRFGSVPAGARVVVTEARDRLQIAEVGG